MPDPIFKGATRPTMRFGIPLIPLVITVLFGSVITVQAFWWFGVGLGILCIVTQIMTIIYMREVTKKDDQKIFQTGKKMLNVPFTKNKNWGGHMTATPQKRRNEKT